MKTRCCSVESLQRLLDHQMSVSEESEVVLHLSHCQDCRKQLETLTADPEFWQDVGEGLRPTSDGSDSFSPQSYQDSDASINPAEDVNQQPNNNSVDRSASLRGSQQPRVATESSSELKLGVNRSLNPGTIPDAESAGQPNHGDQTAAIQFIRQWLAPTDDPSFIGRLGTYEISGIIGIGGMGVVLKGFDPSLHRSVAIKVLGNHLTTSGAARKRFAREAQAAASVVHENVLAIHAIDQWQGIPYFVMPLVRGESLERRLKRNGPFDLIEILRIARQVAAGLDAAHQQGLVHRDIKPANILMEHGSQRLTISDFGLARAGDDASLTRSGLIMGTPLYMSPEQAKGDPVDARSDIFSFGAMLYALCTGHPPFRAETPYGVIRRLCEEDPRSIQQYNPSIPFWFSGIVGQMMQKDIQRRIPTANSLLEIFTVALAYAQQPFESELPKLLEPFSRKPQLQKTVQQNTRLLVAALFAVACTVLLATVVVVGSFLKSDDGSEDQLAQSDSQVQPGNPQSTSTDKSESAINQAESNNSSASNSSTRGSLAAKDEGSDLQNSTVSPASGLTIQKLNTESQQASEKNSVRPEEQSENRAEVNSPPVDAIAKEQVSNGDWRYRFKLDETLRYRCNLELYSKSNVMQVTATIDLETVEVSADTAEFNYEVQIEHKLRQRNSDDPEQWTAEESRAKSRANSSSKSDPNIAGGEVIGQAIGSQTIVENGPFHFSARERAFFPGVFIAPPMAFPFFGDHFGNSRTQGPFDFELRELQACEPSGRIKVSALGGVLGSSHQSNLPGQIGPIIEWIFPALGELDRDSLWRYQRDLQLVAADSGSRNARETILARRSAEFQQKTPKTDEANKLQLEFVISDWNKNPSDSSQSSPLQTLLGSISLDKSNGKLEQLSMARSPVELSAELQTTNVHQLRLNVERVSDR